MEVSTNLWDIKKAQTSSIFSAGPCTAPNQLWWRLRLKHSSNADLVLLLKSLSRCKFGWEIEQYKCCVSYKTRCKYTKFIWNKVHEGLKNNVKTQKKVCTLDFIMSYHRTLLLRFCNGLVPFQGVVLTKGNWTGTIDFSPAMGLTFFGSKNISSFIFCKFTYILHFSS